MAYPSIYLKNFQTSSSPIVHCSKFLNEGGKGGGSSNPVLGVTKFNSVFAQVFTQTMSWLCPYNGC